MAQIIVATFVTVLNLETRQLFLNFDEQQGRIFTFLLIAVYLLFHTTLGYLFIITLCNWEFFHSFLRLFFDPCKYFLLQSLKSNCPFKTSLKIFFSKMYLFWDKSGLPEKRFNFWKYIVYKTKYKGSNKSFVKEKYYYLYKIFEVIIRICEMCGMGNHSQKKIWRVLCS